MIFLEIIHLHNWAITVAAIFEVPVLCNYIVYLVEISHVSSTLCYTILIIRYIMKIAHERRKRALLLKQLTKVTNSSIFQRAISFFYYLFNWSNILPVVSYYYM